MIVKIQTPISSNVPREEWRAFVYNKDRTFQMEVPINEEITRHMKGRPKAFFTINLREGNPFFIEAEAPWQTW